MKTPEGFILKSDAAVICGCTKRTIDNLMKRELIPFYKFGRRVLFKREEVLAALNQSKVPSRSSTAEQAPYKGQVVGSTPAATTPPTAYGSDMDVYKQWTHVLEWLRLIENGKCQKHARLAKDCLCHIKKFIE